jgi:hypothetical protein
MPISTLRRPDAAQQARREFAYHELRILVILSCFTESGEEFIGLTKLAKLDFLLRYPVMASRLLPPGAEWPEGIGPSESEFRAVESRMIRYKYGPWDDRYYPILGALVGRRLISFARPDRFGAVVSEVGRELIDNLRERPEWSIVIRRCEFFRLYFDRPGAELRDLIYINLPDVAALPMRSEI